MSTHFFDGSDEDAVAEEVDQTQAEETPVDIDGRLQEDFLGEEESDDFDEESEE